MRRWGILQTGCGMVYTCHISKKKKKMLIILCIWGGGGGRVYGRQLTLCMKELPRHEHAGDKFEIQNLNIRTGG